ncbi:hypothetical protein ACLKA7_011599 [Drosophila subpalustris]
MCILRLLETHLVCEINRYFSLQAEANVSEDIFDLQNWDIREDTASQLQYAEPSEYDADESEVADIVIDDNNSGSDNSDESIYGDKNKVVDVDANEDNQDDEKPDAYFGSKSFAYQKFKNMDEQQNQKEQQQQTIANSPSEQMGHQKRGQSGRNSKSTRQREPQQQREQLENKEQLFHSIEILNDRKLNKVSAQSTLQAPMALDGDDIMEIGVIEDNFGNDEVLTQNIKSTIDNDESAAEETMPAGTSTNTTTSSGSKKTKTTESTNSTAKTTSASSSYQNISFPVGRKMKRHGNGNTLTWVKGGGYFNNNNFGIGRIQAHNEPHDKVTANSNLEVNSSDVGAVHYYDEIWNTTIAEDSRSKLHANYLDNYFGPNETKEKEQQKQDTRFVNDEEYTEERMLQLESDTALHHPGKLSGYYRGNSDESSTKGAKRDCQYTQEE